MRSNLSFFSICSFFPFLLFPLLLSCGQGGGGEVSTPGQNLVGREKEENKLIDGEMDQWDKKASQEGLIQAGDFPSLEASRRKMILENYLEEAAKIPAVVKDLLRETGSQKFFLVRGTVVNHPELRGFAGKAFSAKAGDSRKTYDDLEAAAFPWGVVIAADVLYSVPLASALLHETAHLYEYALAEKQNRIFGSYPLSSSEEFLTLHRAATWSDPYLAENPEEAFAECFAEFFHSRESRKRLFQRRPLIGRYLEDVFGSPH